MHNRNQLVSCRYTVCVYCSSHVDIEEIIHNFDRKLFSKITHSGHCLHHLLPPKTSEHCSYTLMKRKHYYQLPNVEF